MALHMSEADVDRQKIEQVFRLTGGELDSEPLLIAERYSADGTQLFTWPEGTPRILVTDMTDPRAVRRFHYDGVPEWLTSEYRAASGELEPDYMTVIESVMYGEPDRVLVLPDGSIWIHVAHYTTSGEAECPFREYVDQDEQGDGPYAVTRATAQLSPKPAVRREPLTKEQRARYAGTLGDYHRRPNARHARCPFCENRIGEEHGYIYLGEGEAEVVYQQVGFVRGVHEEENAE